MEPLRPQASPGAQSTTTVPHFSFLPPLTAATIAGDFNPNLRPTVVICRVDVLDNCVEELARYDTDANGIQVSLTNEQYQVNWQITGVIAGEWYRIAVYAGPWSGAPALGWIELQGAEGGGLVSPSGGSSPNIQSTLPIKFRIEDGILCTTLAPDLTSQPCVVAAVGPDGGTIVNEDSTAGAYFPPGALNQWVNVTIERYEPGDPDDSYNTVCLPINDPQYEGCFRFKTDPDLPYFQPVNGDTLPVTVGVCPVPSVFQQAGLFDQLDLYKWDEVDPNSVVFLPPRNVTFLNCPGSPFYNQPTAFMTRVPQPFRAVLQLLAPTPVMAGSTSPYGGGLKDFSRIGWVRKLALSKVSGDNQQAYLGTPVPNDPVVRVTAAGSKVTTIIPVAGVPIQFAAMPDGSATPSSALSDVNGYATTAWTLGTTVGTDSLVVTAFNPLAPAVDVFPNQAGAWGRTAFYATAVTPPPPPPPARYSVVFLSPLTKGKLTPKSLNTEGVPVIVQVCSIDVSSWPCEYARRVVSSGDYRFQWKAGASAPVGRYRFAVIDLTTTPGTVLDSFVGAVAKDGTQLPRGVDFNFQLGSTIPIKFLLIAK